MSTTTYYRDTCGSIYRVTHTPSARQQPARTMQARRSTYATEFSLEYETTAAEVARLVSIGSFVQVPAP